MPRPGWCIPIVPIFPICRVGQLWHASLWIESCFVSPHLSTLYLLPLGQTFTFFPRVGGEVVQAVLATLRVSWVGIIMPSGVVGRAGCCKLWTWRCSFLLGCGQVKSSKGLFPQSLDGSGLTAGIETMNRRRGWGKYLFMALMCPSSSRKPECECEL